MSFFRSPPSPPSPSLPAFVFLSLSLSVSSAHSRVGGAQVDPDAGSGGGSHDGGGLLFFGRLVSFSLVKKKKGRVVEEDSVESFVFSLSLSLSSVTPPFPFFLFF